jgi:hypothetical protein
MKMRGKGGLLESFSVEKLTERTKESSFLDVDWIIQELLNFGHGKMTNQQQNVPKTSSGLTRSVSLKSATKAKIRRVSIYFLNGLY